MILGSCDLRFCGAEGIATVYVLCQVLSSKFSLDALFLDSSKVHQLSCKSLAKQSYVQSCPGGDLQMQ